MSEFSGADGLVILSADIDDVELRDLFWQHVEEIPGERINTTTYEYSIADWEAPDWQEELEWLLNFLEATGEAVAVWHFRGGQCCQMRLGSA